MNIPSKHGLCQPLQHWLDKLPHSAPLRATTESPTFEGSRLEHWIAASQLPSDSLVTAMLWLRVGAIDPPHEIVQEGKTPLASYLHGVVHRLEGDYWNSKYWFRQAKDDSMLQSLSRSMERSLSEAGLLVCASSLKIMQANRFNPSELVTAIEHQNQQSKPNAEEVETLEHICWLEWASLWEIVLPDNV